MKNEIVNQIHLYEYMLKSHELNCEGIVALKMHICNESMYKCISICIVYALTIEIA